jgi:crotonobetainyl-CoA:carnitine CoA-transferase CaiB-like acyl-CoA transferase
MWAMGQQVALALLTDGSQSAASPWANPLVGTYQTKDERWLSLCCLQAGKYWAPACEAIARPELAVDPRFADHAALMAHSDEAIDIVRTAFAEQTLDEWRKRLAGFTGQWAVVQDTRKAAVDPQAAANGYMQRCRTAAGVPFQLVAAPVQFDEEPATPTRGPEFNEHGDAILADLGLDWDTVVDLKVRGVVG